MIDNPQKNCYNVFVVFCAKGEAIAMKKLFPEILGNDATRSRLGGAILRSTLPHALLFVGPSGSGKRTLALQLAAAVNCERVDEDGYALPCGNCGRCKRVLSESFPDLKRLKRDGGKATVGVEELRDFRADMFLSATDARTKVYIIEEGDLMTPAAQNALLKVLEEPPSNVLILILATEADKILTTIKSRTQLIQTEIFGYGKLLENVCELSDTAEAMKRADPKRLRGILLSSAGVIGVALESLDEKRSEEIAKDRALVLSFVEALPKKVPFSKLYTALNSFPTKRDELRSTLESLRIAIRDMTVIRVSEDTEPIFFLSREDAEAAAGSIGAKRLVAVFDIVSEAIEDIDKNVVIAPLLSDMAIKIKEA